MSAASERAQEVVAKIKQSRGPDWYKKIGAMGGRVKGVAKGFAADKQKAREAGRAGGNTTSGKLDG